MTDMDFRQIVPRQGGQREAFEELCCQLGNRKIPGDATFVRLNGAGGDGGIECFADLTNGSRVGWQAKYVFDVDSLITQANKSLNAALQIHPSLTRFVLCFPFDLTGPTGRRGKSGFEKFEFWSKKQIQDVAKQGRKLEIEAWPAAELRSILMEVDVSGGIRKFFFDQQHFSCDWFESHLERAKVIAGPRYTPELNVRTDVGQWLAAFGRTREWLHELENRLGEARKKYKRLSEAITRTCEDASVPKWPDSIHEEAVKISKKIAESLDICDRLKERCDQKIYKQTVELFKQTISGLRTLESKLVTDLKQQHCKSADSPSYGQFMAEYNLSFPAANLDDAREAIAAISELSDWLNSPKGELAFHRAFILSGAWGVGKTHGVCDIAGQRLTRQLLSCIVFGHQFGGEPDPWTRLAESLEIPIGIGKDGLLDALNAAAEASGQPLIIFIDAINETRPIQYWIKRISIVVQQIISRHNLRVCFTCRTPYLSQCLPEAYDLLVVEHRGFKGVEQIACTAFFNHYNLKPPVAPILQPELANPLYLRLVCETLKTRGIDRLPTGWYSTGQVIKAFLEEKEKEFAKEKDIGEGACIVTKSLQSIARKIAEKGQSRLKWSEAYSIISQVRPDAHALHIVEWLIGANLLIEETADASAAFPVESTVRPAFERLGDFIIALELVTRLVDTPLEVAFDTGGLLHSLVRDKRAIEENYGILSALCILIPEQYQGREFPDFVESDEIREIIIEIAITSIPSRDPKTFSSASRVLVRQALSKQDLSQVVRDNILGVSWLPSAIDAMWLHELLQELPLAQRDAYWCSYLHESYEESRTVKRLIEAAFDLPLKALDLDVAERWAIALLWICAATDRRVKDWATRALIKVLSACAAIIPELLPRFLNVDDDEVRGRLLLASYGALIISRNDSVIGKITSIFHAAYRDRSIDFDNAIIRDHMRCISELAETLNVLPEGGKPLLTMEPVISERQLAIPTEESINNYKSLLRFIGNGFDRDFFKYSMTCLRSWEYAVARADMGKWILQRIARDFGYEGSGCESYDNSMLHKYGGGRAKPAWVERISKKYQWIAMHQLASRLHDRFERHRDRWDPKPLRFPLILLEERKLDPTLSLPASTEKLQDSLWSIIAQADLDLNQQLSDEEWVYREDDVPALKQFLSIVEHKDQNWRILNCYPSWGQRSKNTDEDEPYRHVWMHIHSYLVRKEDFAIAYECLHRRNFFGRWMPEAAIWPYGFAGEYPWATPFNTEPEEWHSRGGLRGDLPVEYLPSWNELPLEWEYDATLGHNFHMQVPAREFFRPADLWWDGQDGYRLIEGRTVFRDPSITEGGPLSFIVDADDFVRRLERLGLRIIWTMLGEKLIRGGLHNRQMPRRTFSQIASLTEDSSLQVGDRAFFDDYDEATGPRQGHTSIAKK